MGGRREVVGGALVYARGSYPAAAYPYTAGMHAHADPRPNGSDERGHTRRQDADREDAGRVDDDLLLYNELASWWPLLSAPADYAEEADYFWPRFVEAADEPPRRLLELGSGGGNLASHLKKKVAMTLVDRSAGMLEVSRRLNPDCVHHLGDMRTVRLNEQFDAVLVHDAIMYATTEDDLRAVFDTAWVHCRAGGVLIVAPDCVRETWREQTEKGGHDGEGRSLRYLQWDFDPDPNDTEYTVQFVYLLREGSRAVRIESEQHRLGVFPRQVWFDLLDRAGFEVSAVTDPWKREVFVGRLR